MQTLMPPGSVRRGSRLPGAPGVASRAIALHVERPAVRVVARTAGAPGFHGDLGRLRDELRMANLALALLAPHVRGVIESHAVGLRWENELLRRFLLPGPRGQRNHRGRGGEQRDQRAHGTGGPHFAAVCGGSVMLRNWSALIFSSFCRVPRGHRISIDLIPVSDPSPKCTRLSLEPMNPTLTFT